jgi:hypothetical protein
MRKVVSRLDDEQREALLKLADLGTAIFSSGLIVATLMCVFCTTAAHAQDSFARVPLL